MRIDHDLMFADAQADVRNAGTYDSTNVYNLGLSKGSQVINGGYLVIRVDAAFTGGTSVAFQLVCADDEALDTNCTVLGSSGAIVDASLTVDKIVWVFPIPRDIPRQYLGVQAIGVGTHSAGTFDAFITDEYPVGAF